jgi:carbonic anhydrase
MSKPLLEHPLFAILIWRDYLRLSSFQISHHSVQLVRSRAGFRMHRLLPVESKKNILPEYDGTPIGLLLEYHNLGRPFDSYSDARLLIGMCMDNRKHLHIPDNFAFIIRAGGANLRYSEFKVSFAIAVGGVQSIALVGHNQCGMVNLISRKEQFVRGLVERAGWEQQAAEEHFHHYAPMFEIGSETDFVLSEVKRLRLRYPRVLVAPLLYKVEDNRLYFIEEVKK